MRPKVLLTITLLVTFLACDERRAHNEMPQQKPPLRSDEHEQRLRPEPREPPEASAGSPFQYPVYRFSRPPAPDEPVRDPKVPPRLLKSVPPEYTAEARKQRIEGVVVLELVIEPDGRVSSATILKPLPSGLTQRAIQAIQQWRYSPAKDGLRAVRAFHRVTLDFKLPDSTGR